MRLVFQQAVGHEKELVPSELRVPAANKSHVGHGDEAASVPVTGLGREDGEVCIWSDGEEGVPQEGLTADQSPAEPVTFSTEMQQSGYRVPCLFDFVISSFILLD